MKYISEYVTYKDRDDNLAYGGKSFHNNKYWYRKMVSDVADFYYDSEVTFLNRGAFGEVFIFNNYPSKVMKITTGRNEIRLIERMRKLPELKHVINYYDVRKIEVPNNKVVHDSYWSILMDRIIPLEKYKKGIYELLYDSYSIFINMDNLQNKISYVKNLFKTKYSFEIFYEHFKETYVEKKVNRVSEEDSRKFILQVQEAILELIKYNLLHLGDSHSGNVGFKTNGNFCFYDMQYYGGHTNKLKLKPHVFNR